MSLQFKRPQAKQTTSQCNILIRGPPCPRCLTTQAFWPHQAEIGLSTIQTFRSWGRGGREDPKRQSIFPSEMKIKGTVSTDYWCIWFRENWCLFQINIRVLSVYIDGISPLIRTPYVCFFFFSEFSLIFFTYELSVAPFRAFSRITSNWF